MSSISRKFTEMRPTRYQPYQANSSSTSRKFTEMKLSRYQPTQESKTSSPRYTEMRETIFQSTSQNCYEKSRKRQSPESEYMSRSNEDSRTTSQSPPSTKRSRHDSPSQSSPSHSWNHHHEERVSRKYQSQSRKMVDEKTKKAKSLLGNAVTVPCRRIIPAPKVVVAEEEESDEEILDEEFEQWYQENFWGDF